MKISRKLSNNLEAIKDCFDGDKTFDLVNRDFKIAGRKATLFFIDGFKDDIIIDRMLSYLMQTEKKELSADFLTKLINNVLPVAEVELLDTIDEVTDEVLTGPQVLLIDGLNKAIAVDARSWLSRGPEEPELEKATRGAEDGFVETMMFNIQLVRRRIRDTNLRVEGLRVGTKAQNDVAILYIKDMADLDLVERIKERIEDIDIKGLPLADRTIEDFITGNRLNPLPKVRYTNRPDIAAAHLFEGKICVIVDNSPTVLILPATFFDHTQNLEEYRNPPIPGSYFNLIRLLAVVVSISLPPLWLLLAYQPEWLPEMWEFIGPKEQMKISLGGQFVLASLGIDLIRIASIQTPSALATSLSLIGALILGEFSVQVGLFNPETILYLAVGTISNFAIPGFELSLTLGLMRFALIILVILFRDIGLVAGLIMIFLTFALTKSFGVHYLWPLIPFDWSALKSYLFRSSAVSLENRRQNVPGSKDFDNK